ncbi:probable serine/threonine-protein kinase dyrk2 isoform X1 [Pseudophryne corroboree]
MLGERRRIQQDRARRHGFTAIPGTSPATMTDLQADQGPSSPPASTSSTTTTRPVDVHVAKSSISLQSHLGRLRPLAASTTTPHSSIPGPSIMRVLQAYLDLLGPLMTTTTTPPSGIPGPSISLQADQGPLHPPAPTSTSTTTTATTTTTAQPGPEQRAIFRGSKSGNCF